MKTIATIITVHNRISYLEKCLYSLINQSVKPDEIIICDDGSYENVADFLKSFSKQNNCLIKYVRQEFNGFRVARSRNNAVLYSKSDILVFLDSDVVITQNYIKSIYDFFQSNYKYFITNYPVRLTQEQTDKLSLDNIAQYKFDIITFKQKFKIFRQFIKDYFYTITNKLRGISKRYSPKLRGGCLAITREDFFAVNGYDERFIGWGNEDDNLSKRLYIYGLNGRNIGLREFPIHLYHTPFHNNGYRSNKNLANELKKEINAGNFYTPYGMLNRYQKDEIFYAEF